MLSQKRPLILFGAAIFFGFTAVISSSVAYYDWPVFSLPAAADRGQVLGASEEARAGATFADAFIPAPPLKNGEEDFVLAAGYGIAIDALSGAALFEQAATSVVPIASLTKLMTALVFLDHNPGWDSVYTLKSDDITGGGRSYLSPGEAATARDLFNLALVGSVNTAARALVGAAGMDEEEFVVNMNRKALEIGLIATRFAEPVGLDHENVSTAREAAELARVALGKEEVREAVGRKSYAFLTAAGRPISVLSTDALLNVFPKDGIDMIGGKTGYTVPAGYCFAGGFRNGGDHEVIAVILGGDSRDGSFHDTTDLVSWAFRNYTWN